MFSLLASHNYTHYNTHSHTDTQHTNTQNVLVIIFCVVSCVVFFVHLSLYNTSSKCSNINIFIIHHGLFLVYFYNMNININKRRREPIIFTIAGLGQPYLPLHPWTVAWVGQHDTLCAELPLQPVLLSDKEKLFSFPGRP